jgi:hypothetical protein
MRRSWGAKAADAPYPLARAVDAMRAERVVQPVRRYGVVDAGLPGRACLCRPAWKKGAPNNSGVLSESK